MSINGTKGLNELSSEKVMYDSIIQVPEKDLSSPSYTMPGVLHFLQSEWAKMESERGLWEIERAELQVLSQSSCSLYLNYAFCFFLL